MAVFTSDEARWDRIDFAAIAGDGFVVIAEDDADACRAWLAAQHYDVRSLDCTGGVEHVYREINRVFGWVDQFGYEFAGHSLDALRDGFHLDVPAEGGVVLELVRADLLWEQDATLMSAMLEFASELARAQIARGRRFFATVVVPRNAAMLGQTICEVRIPSCWHRHGARQPFALTGGPDSV